MATGEATGGDGGGPTTGDRPDVAEPVGVVVGENLRRIRESRRLTQHEAARMCQRVGLNWSRSRLAGVEGGARETVDVGTLVLLAAAFDVPVSDFFEGGGRIQLSAQSRQSRVGVHRLLSSSSTWRDLPDADQEEVTRTLAIEVEADEALAKRLGTTTGRIIDAAAAMWRRSLTEERDRRVAALGPMDSGERQGRRGHITRELGQQIERLLQLEADHEAAHRDLVASYHEAKTIERHQQLSAERDMDTEDDHARRHMLAAESDALQQARGAADTRLASRVKTLRTIRSEIQRLGATPPPMPAEVTRLEQAAAEDGGEP